MVGMCGWKDVARPGHLLPLCVAFYGAKKTHKTIKGCERSLNGNFVRSRAKKAKNVT